MESTRPRTEKKKRIIAAAIIVPVAIMATIILAIPSTKTVVTSQIETPTLERLTESSGIVVVGTIENVDVKPYIYEIRGDPERGEPEITEERHLMAYVTIRADEYLKDSEDGKEKVTFLDFANGCFDALQKDCIEYDLAYSYKVGDKAVFFLNKFDGINYGTGGFTSVYPIVSEGQENPKVQSKLMERQDKQPLDLDDFKNEIKDLAEGEKGV